MTYPGRSTKGMAFQLIPRTSPALVKPAPVRIHDHVAHCRCTR
jgi:hypothetical protein